jgi:hypothetical protein
LAFRTASGNVALSDLWIAAVLLPAAAFGYLFSTFTKDRMNASLARSGVLAISAVGGIGLIARALLG